MADGRRAYGQDRFEFGDAPRVDVAYYVTSAADHDAVATWIEANVAEYDTFASLRLKRTSYRIEEEIHEGDEWRVRVSYTLPAIDDTTPPTPGKSFTTAGGTQHITTSKATIANYPAGTSPVHKQVIGFDGENVNGCDVVVPIFDFGQTMFKTAAEVNSAYISAIINATGKTNSDAVTTSPFGSFAIGELLFLGADGVQPIPGGDWEINYRFSCSRNQTGLTIGDITGVAKKGWEYMWIRFKDNESNDSPIKEPLSVHVERVYDSTTILSLDLDGWS